MATYLDRHALLADSNFDKRIQIAMMVSAFAIINEGAAPGHVRRMQWVQRVVRDAVKTPRRLIALMILLDPAIDGTSSDLTLQARVDSLISEFITIELENG